MTAPRKSLEPYLYDSIEYYNHQIVGVRTLARWRSFILGDDMGLGKSLQALTVAAVDVVLDKAERIIIVCPVSLRGNWADEIQTFTRFEYMMLGAGVDKKGKPKKLGPKDRETQIREFMADSGPRIMICNYEQVVAHTVLMNKCKFDIGIFDEAHYLQNFKSQRTKACLKLNNGRSFLLTGTPMLNHIDGLWPLLNKVQPSEWPGYWNFLKRYAVYGGFQDKQIIGVKNEKELIERLHGVMLRRTKAEVLDLPAVQIVQRKVDILPQQRKLYDQVIDEMQIETYDSEEPQDIENALTKFLRLKQICGTTLAFTGEDHSAKLDLAVEEAIEVMRNGHKIVVFTQFRKVLEAFCERLDKAAPEFDQWELHGDISSEERQPTVKAWGTHNGAAALVCMIQVAGVGLNMTQARHAFFIDKLFTPGMNQQAIDRLHRIGADATQPVQVYEYMCRGTIETRVEQILHVKKSLFGTIVDVSDFKKKLIKAMLEDEDDE